MSHLSFLRKQGQTGSDRPAPLSLLCLKSKKLVSFKTKSERKSSKGWQKSKDKTWHFDSLCWLSQAMWQRTHFLQNLGTIRQSKALVISCWKIFMATLYPFVFVNIIMLPLTFVEFQHIFRIKQVWVMLPETTANIKIWAALLQKSKLWQDKEVNT